METRHDASLSIKEIMEKETKPFGTQHIVLLIVAFGLLAAALAFLAISNHNQKKQAIADEQAWIACTFSRLSISLIRCMVVWR